MKQLFFTLCLLFSVVANAQQKSYKLAITQVAQNYYVFTTYKDYQGSPFPANGLYVVTDAGVVMIDSPWDTDKTQQLLDSIEIKHHKKVVLAIATHAHADRTGAFDILKKQGIKTYSSALTKQLCIEQNEKQAEFVFTKDTTFRVGDLTINTFFPGEGHTKDNIVVWFDKDRILYGGCFVKGMSATDLGNIKEANIKAWPVSVQNTMRQYPMPSLIIPGHQEWAPGYQCLVHTLKLLSKQ